jgi:ubiquinone/menaquinone biosynthesis C-methylase UbiE
MADKIITEVPTAEGYNKWAPIYETNGNPMTALDEMAFMEHFPINQLPGKKVLDLGCGTGRLTTRLAEKGGNVIGLDGSEGMLNVARSKNSNADYVLHDLSKTLPFADQEFDMVTSNLVLEHIENLDFFFSEIARVSKHDAFIYISAMHPAMYLKTNQANFTDPKTGIEIRPKGYDHQLSAFIMSINKSGLVLQHMNEFSGSEELATIVPKATKYIGWPMLVTFRMKPSLT